ncbi:hypothetical protein GCM10022627_37810 [Haloarcula argentinensis]
MQDADATIYLTCTSNIISSGQREVVAYLVREGYVDVLITTAGVLAEGIIKTAKPFKTGSWMRTKPRSGNRVLTALKISSSLPTDTSGWGNTFRTSSMI